MRIRAEAAATKAGQDEKLAPLLAASAAQAEEDAALEARFAEAVAVDEAMLDELCDLVKARLGVSSVYICRKEATEGPDESAAGGEDAEDDDGEGGGASFQLRYVGASSNAQAIKAKHVVEPAGITFDSWKVPVAAGGEDGEEEAEEEDEDDLGGQKKVKEVPPPPELPVVHVRNVLRERRIKLHELPRLGEYVAVPLRYNSLAHPDCFPPEPEKPEGEEDAEPDADADAEGKDEGEADEKAGGDAGASAAAGDAAPVPVPAGVPLERHLAICFDTLGQDRRVSAADVEAVKRWTGVLAAALERTEQAQYEVEFGAKQAAAAAEAAAVGEVEAGREEAAAAAAEAKAAASEEAGGEAAPEDVKALLEANERASIALSGLEHARSRLEGIAGSALAPSEAAVTTLHTACRVTGSDEATLGDAGARKKTRPFWGSVRKVVRDGLVAKMAAWRPEEAAAASGEEGAIKPDAVAAALEGVDADAAKAASIAVGLVLEWCKAAGEATAAAAAKATREGEEAEAAAAAAAAAAAEGGAADAPAQGDEEEDE